MKNTLFVFALTLFCSTFSFAAEILKIDAGKDIVWVSQVASDKIKMKAHK